MQSKPEFLDSQGVTHLVYKLDERYFKKSENMDIDIDVDEALSDTSINPVQNKVITAELNNTLENAKTFTNNAISLCSIQAVDDDGIVTLFFELRPAGLYETGSNYTVLRASWADLIADGVVHVDNGVLTTNSTGTDYSNENSSSDVLEGDLVLPANYSISSIGEQAFCNCKKLTGIQIPGDLSSIESYAFKGCSNLRDINLPTGITAINDFTFASCLNLNNIVIPEGITTIGNSAFESHRLNSLTIPATVKTIGANAFSSQYAKELNEIIFEEGSLLNTIGDYAFLNLSCTGIEIPENVVTVGLAALRGCFNIAVNPSNSCYYVKNNCLISSATNSLICGGINSMVPDDNTIITIGEEAFKQISLPSITLPDSIVSIGKEAFYWSLRTPSDLHIPASVTSIGEYAFGFNSISKLTFAEDSELLTIGENAFALSLTGFTGSLRLPDKLRSIGDSAFAYSSITSVFIPDSIIEMPACFGYPSTVLGDTYVLSSILFPENSQRTHIPAYAFYGCKGLTSVNLPSSITTIEDNAFENCTSLLDINFPNTLTFIGNNAFARCALGSAIIPNTVTYIGSKAFYSNKLTSVSIPENLLEIKSQTFAANNDLITISFPEALQTIGDYAFGACASLASITFAENSELKTIDQAAFKECTKLTEVIIPGKVTTIGGQAFYDCDLSTITIPASVESIGFWALGNITSLIFEENNQLTSFKLDVVYDPAALTTLVVPDCINQLSSVSVTENGSNLDLSRCNNLTDIYFGAGSQVTSLPLSCFSKNTKLANINFNENCKLKTIGVDAFRSTKITNFIVPKNVVTIEAQAFHYLNTLTSVTFAEGSQLATIGNNAFRETGLTDIAIPASVSTIGRYAFHNCNNLTNIEMTEGVTFIGDYAFTDTSITSIFLPKSLTTLGSAVIPNTCLDIYYAGSQNDWYILTNNPDGYYPDTTVHYNWVA